MDGEWNSLVSVLESCNNASLSHQTSIVAAVVSMVVSQNMQRNFVMKYKLVPPETPERAACLCIQFDSPIRGSMSMFTACAISIGPLLVKDILVHSDSEWHVEFYTHPQMPTGPREPLMIMVSQSLRPVMVVTPDQQNALVPVPQDAPSPRRPQSRNILERLGWSWSLFGKDKSDDDDDDDVRRPAKKRHRPRDDTDDEE